MSALSGGGPPVRQSRGRRWETFRDRLRRCDVHTECRTAPTSSPHTVCVRASARWADRSDSQNQVFGRSRGPHRRFVVAGIRRRTHRRNRSRNGRGSSRVPTSSRFGSLGARRTQAARAQPPKPNPISGPSTPRSAWACSQETSARRPSDRPGFRFAGVRKAGLRTRRWRRASLRSLVERGLRADRWRLFVIDGPKALRSDHRMLDGRESAVCRWRVMPFRFEQESSCPGPVLVRAGNSPRRNRPHHVHRQRGVHRAGRVAGRQGRAR